VCGQSLKTIFQIFEKQRGNIIYQKIHLIFEINSYTFKVATTKIS
jgi:hypothetical protein